MRKVILLPFVLSLVVTNAQPKIVSTLGYWGAKGGGGLVRTDLPGLTPGSIYSFDNTSPHNPSGGVCAGDGNWLYGITYNGGANNRGAFYRIQQNGTLLTTLYHFRYNVAF